MAQNRLSRISWIVCSVVMCYVSFFAYPRWKQPDTEATISWDVSGYYWYLPSCFIYRDLKRQDFKDALIEKYRPTNLDFQQAAKADNGNYVFKYPVGMAVMYLPFFAAAHVVAHMAGYPADGFSHPYQFAIQLGGFLVSILGLWYLRKLLLLYYSDTVAAITIFIIALGTNYLEYAAVNSGMSHCWLFTLYVLLLLNTHHFYKSYQTKYALRIGLLVGLLTLTRFTEVISCLIPLLWGLDSVKQAKERFPLLARHFQLFILSAVVALLVVSIQFVYWKRVSGHWLVYSYGSQGFSFHDPHFFNYTLSYRSGWLTYCPMMIFAFLGLLPFLRRGRNRVAVISFFLVSYYIVCSWDIWWYGGRAMIQSYPVLAFPIASLVAFTLQRKITAVLLLPAALVFFYMNAWISYNYHKGALYDPESMTEPYFWRVAGRWTVPPATLSLRDKADLFEGTPRNMKLVCEKDMENDTSVFATAKAISGGRSLLITGGQAVALVRMPFQGGGAEWIRVQATFRCTQKEWDVWNMAQLVVKLRNAAEPDVKKNVSYNMLRIFRQLSDNQTKEIYLDMKLPSASYDVLEVWIENEFSGKEFTVDDVKVWAFNQ